MNTFPLRPAALAAVAVLLAASVAPAATLREKPKREGGYGFRSAMTIGGAEAGEDADFYERYGPVAVDASSNGEVYVLDNGNVRVQVFDSRGKFLRSIGSEGDGPGEFRIPASIAVNSAGDFAVFDMGQERVSVLDARGKLLYDVLVQGMAKDIALRDDRTVVLGFGDVGPAAVQAYGADGKLLWSGGSRNVPDGPHVEMEIGIQTIASRLAVIPSGAAFRCPKGDYELQRFTKGEAVVFTRPFERRKFSEEELAPPSDDEGGEPQVIMITREGPGGGDGGGHGAPSGGGSPSFTSEEGQSFTFDMESLRSMMPSHHSATRGVLAWPDGRVWVLTSEKGKGGLHADEWSADGEWLRRFDVPEEYDWLNVGRDGRLYGVTHDEDDYPTIHWLEVREGA